MSTSTPTNHKNRAEQSILVSKNLFVLYLIMSSNFLANLFGCKVQKALNESMILKHVLGFFTLYFFVSLVETSNAISSKLLDRMAYAGIIYLWFLLSTRMNIKIWYSLVVILLTTYVLQLNVENEKKKDKPNQELIKTYVQVQQVLVVVSVIITIVGFFAYLHEKQVEYGKSFDFTTFMVGVKQCKE
jgi:hypothetical protein